jgi:hypothetical protein
MRVRLVVEIWRHVDEPEVIHLTHDRFDAQVTDREGRPGYDPTLYATLSELLDESEEVPGGRRQRGEGKRARRSDEPRPEVEERQVRYELSGGAAACSRRLRCERSIRLCQAKHDVGVRWLLHRTDERPDPLGDRGSRVGGLPCGIGL